MLLCTKSNKALSPFRFRSKLFRPQTRNHNTSTEVTTILDPYQHVLAGQGALDEMARLIKKNKWRPFIVTDPGIVASGILSDVKQSFTQIGLKPVVWANTRENPPLEDVKEISYAMENSGCDCIIGMTICLARYLFYLQDFSAALGGGGPMDAAKASLLLLTKSDTGYTAAPKSMFFPWP